MPDFRDSFTACEVCEGMLPRAVTIDCSIDKKAAIRSFWRYRDIFCCSDIDDISSVHPAVILVKLSFCREVFWMFWLFSLLSLFGSCQSHDKKLESRHRFVSYRNGIMFWKSWGHWKVKIGKWFAVQLTCCRKIFGEQQGSWMLALRVCREMQCRHYQPDDTRGQVAERPGTSAGNGQLSYVQRSKAAKPAYLGDAYFPVVLQEAFTSNLSDNVSNFYIIVNIKC